jgi:iron complex outermembrane receptor protein
VLDIPAFYDDRQFTQELQLLFDGDRIQGVAGLYYLDAHAPAARLIRCWAPSTPQR